MAELKYSLCDCYFNKWKNVVQFIYVLSLFFSDVGYTSDIKAQTYSHYSEDLRIYILFLNCATPIILNSNWYFDTLIKTCITNVKKHFLHSILKRVQILENLFQIRTQNNKYEKFQTNIR